MKIQIDNIPENEKIANIKLIRYLKDIGLKEALDVVNALPFKDEVASCILDIPDPSDVEHLNHVAINCNYPPELPLPIISKPKTVKPKTAGNQAFNVPNTEEGQAFLKQARRFSNSPMASLHSRGRGTRKDHFRKDGSLPVNKAEWIALYVKNSYSADNEKEIYRLVSKLNSARIDLDHARTAVKAELDDLKIKNAKLAMAKVTAIKQVQQQNKELVELQCKQDELSAKITKMEKKAALPTEVEPVETASKNGVTFQTHPNSIDIMTKFTVHNISAFHEIMNALAELHKPT